MGAAAIAGLMARDNQAKASAAAQLTHFAPKAKRIVYLFQSGGPSHLELLDHKPNLKKLHGTELPDSIRHGQRLTGMTSGQKSFPVIAPKFKFHQAGQAGTWVSELLPHTARVMDDICLIRSMHTEAINHDPAITFIQTGSQQPGRPSLGAWLSYGLGSEADDLPAFIVLISHGSGKDANQGLLERLWGSGFLPSSHQGVKFRSSGDSVLYLSDPPGMDRELRRQMLDGLAQLNQRELAQSGDPEIATRISQYEMAFRMQSSVPDLTDLSKESANTFELYGEESKKPGTFAANCLLARRMLERGVRCVQLYHRGWDQHGGLPTNIPKQAHDIDQPQAALITDLKQRDMLKDTIIVFGSEFGRTPMAQGNGRDHHLAGFTMWFAGGGFKPGMSYGNTDEFGYHAVENRVSVHDVHATLLHQMGIDHSRFTYKFQGLDSKLTGVEEANVVKDLLV